MDSLMLEKRFFYIVVFSIIFIITFCFFVAISYKNINIYIFNQEIEALVVDKQSDFFVPGSSDYEIKYTFNEEIYFGQFSSKYDFNKGEKIVIYVSDKNPSYFNYNDSFFINPLILFLCCLVLALVILLIIKQPKIIKKFGGSFPSS